MAISTITILEVPGEVRAVGAASARKHLLGLLNNPYLTQEQILELQTQLKEVSARECLVTIPTEPVPTSVQQVENTRQPKHHVLKLTETLTETDKVS